MAHNVIASFDSFTVQEAVATKHEPTHLIEENGMPSNQRAKSNAEMLNIHMAVGLASPTRQKCKTFRDFHREVATFNWCRSGGGCGDQCS